MTICDHCRDTERPTFPVKTGVIPRDKAVGEPNYWDLDLCRKCYEGLVRHISNGPSGEERAAT